MGAKYDYCIAFRSREISDMKWGEVAMRGFDGMWRRFGGPNTLSRQNFEQLTVFDSHYSMGAFLDLLPPPHGETVVMYTERVPPNALLAFYEEDPFTIVCASIDTELLSDELRSALLEEFKVSLAEFAPAILVAGEELYDGLELVTRVLGGEPLPIPELCAELAVTFD